MTIDAKNRIYGTLNALLADVFALYIKTKNFHWHVSGQHFRDYHLLLDDQSDQVISIADLLAERIRKIGGSTIRSIGHIACLQRLADNDAQYVASSEMLSELNKDNGQLAASMRQAHQLCSDNSDWATTSLLENWIDQAEGRSWFLAEILAPTQQEKKS